VHRATGLQCPVCGMTRAVVALAHGHLVTSLRMNALAVPLLLMLCAMSSTRVARWLGGLRASCERYLAGLNLRWLGTLGAVSYAVGRNLV
jgi:hypothetical protein